MINRSDLLKDLQRELPKIEKDILEYSESKEELAEHLQEEYEKAQSAGRTAEHFVAWREAQITQAAVAWLLTCVFVRFLEDNDLLVEPMLSGPASTNIDGEETNPLQYAKERMVAFFNINPTLEERDYLLDLFEELERFPVIAELLDHRHNPLWQIPVSSDGAKGLIDFFQKINADSGKIIHDFTDADWDTRFLGDLYQDLSESVRKRYALLQTPEFVESFILDYTLEKAIDTFGLTHGKPDSLRLIDPTCGSGHFLLTTFERIFDAWKKREPGTNARELAQRALDVVHGVDINPYAIAICRFRLFIAAMKAAGSHKVKDAPNFHFNLACGDSLLHGRRFEWLGQGQQTDLIDEDPVKHVLEVEDKEKLLKILGQQYHAVVGNPPYIIVKDKALNMAYRDRYTTCHKKYSLGVPFTERFFDLAFTDKSGGYAGFVGLITANSFMKREFGSKLIQEYFPTKNLTHAVDTSGAYIPGHGTPTVILFGRNQNAKSETVRIVQSIRGEPSTPKVPSEGLVWASIKNKIELVGTENDYISVVDLERSSLSQFPWSLQGGGVDHVKAMVDKSGVCTLLDHIEGIGFGGITGEDDLFVLPTSAQKVGISKEHMRTFVEGDRVRDWSVHSDTLCVFPYSPTMKASSEKAIYHRLWPKKVNLRNRVYFRKTQLERGLKWFEYGYQSSKKCMSPMLIPFAFVSTHNHFVLDRGGNFFNRSAPVIQLSNDKDENDHFALLGLLNSSVSCFWMKQVFHNKGDSTDSAGARVTGDPAFDTYEFTGTGLKNFPIPDIKNDEIIKYSKAIDECAENLKSLSPKLLLNSLLPEADLKLELEFLAESYSKTYGCMVSLQEEVDWLCYTLFGLTDTRLLYDGVLPSIQPGERAFEIVLAKKVEEGKTVSSWFKRHGISPVTDTNAEWSEEYTNLVKTRIEFIAKNKNLLVVEQPEYKRRWHFSNWKNDVTAACKGWLLECIENEYLAISDSLNSCAQISDRLRSNAQFLQVASEYTGDTYCDIQSLVNELISAVNVPQASVTYLKPKALPKFKAWQETWDKQRQEDAIDKEFGVDTPLSDVDAANDEKVVAFDIAKRKAAAKRLEIVGEVPIPPKYAAGDFLKPIYWSLRGKLDVPKERFFSLPGCEKDGDSTLVIGWAGMNHLQRATAIATWYLDRKETDGWEAEKLKPMLVALDELIPWLKQWHNEIDPEFGERMGDYYEGFLSEEMRMLDVTKDDLLAWEPPAAPKKKAAAKKKTAVKKAKSKKDTSAEASDTDTSKEQG